MPDPIETIIATPLMNRIETDDSALQVVVIEIVGAADTSGSDKREPPAHGYRRW